MRRLVPIAATSLALYAALLVVEQLRSDEPFDLFDLALEIFEILLLASAVLMTALFSVEARQIKSERKEMLRDLHDARADSERWRATARRHVEGLSKAIAGQFRAWKLTEAEADIAGLMLKGLSHKEIAAFRATAPATIRRHAASIYQKSNLSNRSQLTAFFLEELLAPASGTESVHELKVVDGDD